MKHVPAWSASLFLAACAVPPQPSAVDAFEPTESATAALLAVPRRAGSEKSYTVAKGGVFMPSGDIEDLDDGAAVELIFGRDLMPFLSIEGSLGYLGAEGNVGAFDFDLWAVPLFVNGRLNLPILIFEGYAGIGFGGMYVDYEATGLFSDEDFVFAGSAFLGAEVGLGGVALGIEYKYVQSEETKNDFSVEGSVVSVFASLPF